MMTDLEAEKQGFTIDCTCWPWVAYKGPRFDPTEWHEVFAYDPSKDLPGWVDR